MTAGSAAAKTIQRWSLQSLARLKTDLGDPQALQVVTPMARDLAKDVAIRLEEQKLHVEHMERYVQQNLLQGISSTTTTTSTEKDQEQRDPNTPSTNHSNNNKNKVIATSNFAEASWWNNPPKAPPKTDPQRHGILEKAKKNLHDLKVLHESTRDVANALYLHLDQKSPLNHTSQQDSFLDQKETKWIKAALRQVRDRHALTVENLAEFVITTRPYWETPQALDPTVMDFLRGRLGVQLLCEHYLAPSGDEGHGIVCVDCPLSVVLEDAITEASILCESNYSHLVTAAPEVVIVNQTLGRQDHFTIVRPWVHYVLVELLKNAMAISMERMEEQQRGKNSQQGLPPAIYISIDDHHEKGDDLKSYLSIDVLDQGGGFSNPDLTKSTDIMFDFVRTKTTMWDRLDDQQTYAMPSSPMQGLGVGLCLSRLAMEHFGGTVDLKQHPPLSMCQQHAFAEYDVEAGCVASIRLLKDLDHPEQLFGDENQTPHEIVCD